MGIHCLLQVLKPAMRIVKLSELKGKTCVIDAMGWLYRGAFSCAYNHGPESKSLGYMSYPIKFLKLLQKNGITPILVFDGRPIEGKGECEKKRQSFKKKNEEMAQLCREEGRSMEARKHSSRALVIKSRQIDLLQEICTSIGVQHITAPYEADVQMAFMVKEKLADFAITEDSDLIVYGCPVVLTKLSPKGVGELFDYPKFKASTDRREWDDKLVTLQSLSFSQFRYLCVMSGCEYLQSLERLGLKTMLKFFTADLSFREVIASLRDNIKFRDRIPLDYEAQVEKAVTIFKFQTVYDPRSRTFKANFKPAPGEDFDQDFVGPLLAKEDAKAYAEGVVEKKTLQPKQKVLHMFDLKHFLKDWKANKLGERSFRPLSGDLFDYSLPWQALEGSSRLSKIYPRSSKEWLKIVADLNRDIEDEKRRVLEEQRRENAELMKQAAANAFDYFPRGQETPKTQGAVAPAVQPVVIQKTISSSEQQQQEQSRKFRSPTELQPKEGGCTHKKKSKHPSSSKKPQGAESEPKRPSDWSKVSPLEELNGKRVGRKRTILEMLDFYLN